MEEVEDFYSMFFNLSYGTLLLANLIGVPFFCKLLRILRILVNPFDCKSDHAGFFRASKFAFVSWS